MHDLLRDMEREIVQKKSKEVSEEPSRIWRYEDVHKLSKDTVRSDFMLLLSLRQTMDFKY